MKTWRLQSAEMIDAPGMLRWAMNGYKFKKDRKQLLKTFFTGWPGPTEADYHGLLSGTIPHTIVDNCVIFEVNDE